MNFDFDLRPHLEFLVIAICSFLQYTSLGVVKMEPKGIEEFNDNAIKLGNLVGFLGTCLFYGWLGSLYVLPRLV